MKQIATFCNEDGITFHYHIQQFLHALKKIFVSLIQTFCKSIQERPINTLYKSVARICQLLSCTKTGLSFPKVAGI